MLNQQTHYQTNRQFLLILGSTFFGGGLLLLLGFNLYFSSLTPNAISSLPFFVISALSLAQPLLLLVVLIGAFQLSVASTKIVTSSEKIEFHQAGFRARSHWNNVARISSFQVNNVSGQALYFHQPAKQVFSLLPFTAISSIKMIPLNNFDLNDHGELKAALRRYRLDLFFN